LQDVARQRSQAQEAGVLPTINDKLLFICMYLKTYPIQELQAAFFDMDQPQAHFWIHRLARLLLLTLQRLAHTPERDATALRDCLETRQYRINTCPHPTISQR
jgi:Helix-turn-helix of DDE superfamily endonuclease